MNIGSSLLDIGYSIALSRLNSVFCFLYPLPYILSPRPWILDILLHSPPARNSRVAPLFKRSIRVEKGSLDQLAQDMAYDAVGFLDARSLRGWNPDAAVADFGRGQSRRAREGDCCDAELPARFHCPQDVRRAPACREPEKNVAG